jgi:hypothetical protein
MTVLTEIELVPVIEVPPGVLRLPLGPAHGSAEEEDGSWPDDLAAAEVTGLYPTAQLTDPGDVTRFLEALHQRYTDEAQPAGTINPSWELDCIPYLDGGMMLCSGDDILVGPGCCADLSNLASWREAAVYLGAEWHMVWIGHPWISIRYDEGSLLLSERHESDAPVPRWALSPDDLSRAVAKAESELVEFAKRLQAALETLGASDAGFLAKRLAGLAS